MRRRRLSLRRLRGSRLHDRHARPEGLQRGRHPLQGAPRGRDPRTSRSDGDDQQSRYIEATVATPRGVVRVASIYLPNGNPIGTDKFAYKLAWMARLDRHARKLLMGEDAAGACRRFQRHPRAGRRQAPRGLDRRRPVPARSRARRFRKLLDLGLTDAVRACHPEPGLYTFWDYQAGAWQKDDGIRIDHLLALARGRRPARGSRRSTGSHAAGRSLPTMPRLGSSSTV